MKFDYFGSERIHSPTFQPPLSVSVSLCDVRLSVQRRGPRGVAANCIPAGLHEAPLFALRLDSYVFVFTPLATVAGTGLYFANCGDGAYACTYGCVCE